jgi:hypothetical protein
MLTETLKTKTASLPLFALATLMTVVSSVTEQILREQNFSSGFEEWTVVNPPGSFNASRWKVGPGRCWDLSRDPVSCEQSGRME